MATDSLIGQRWAVMRDALDERQRRLLAAAEAKVLGRGGVSAVSVATGVSRTTIMAGLGEIEAMQSRDGTEKQTVTRARQSGGGRKKIETKDETLLPDLLSLVDSTTRGDPESPLRWTCIQVHHFPPGTSKWNKIEHRLFSFITMNWRGQPLISHEVIVNLISSTKTRSGLTVRSEIDNAQYPKGLAVSDADWAAINIERNEFHGEWNYCIHPE